MLYKKKQNAARRATVCIISNHIIAAAWLDGGCVCACSLAVLWSSCVYAQLGSHQVNVYLTYHLLFIYLFIFDKQCISYSILVFFCLF